MAKRQPQFNQSLLLDTTPLPDDIPKVKEIGTSSAPLMSASFFIGARCRPYNDDYMKCKTEAYGTGEFDCMREGRKVTRCAASVLEDINKHCLHEFRFHWQCLERNNQHMTDCRGPEQLLNKCVFEKLNLEKHVPGQPTNITPVHLRQTQIFSYERSSQRANEDLPQWKQTIAKWEQGKKDLDERQRIAREKGEDENRGNKVPGVHLK